MKTEEKVNVELSYRLVNINFDGFDEFRISDNIILRKLSNEELERKYPINKVLIGLGELESQNWKNHMIEATIGLKIAQNESENIIRTLTIDYYQKLIIEPFLFSGILSDSMPYATHCFVKIIDKKTLCSLRFNGYKFIPDKLKIKQLEEISNSYRILREANSDSVLRKALNRYFIAVHEESNNPNLINIPNWDKILYYIITMETILLSTPSGNKTELNYRFKLNGTTLLSEIINVDKRIIFDVLGKLYEIRSIIVHGGDEKKIIKNIDIIFSKLQITNISQDNYMEQLNVISTLLERWIRFLFEKLTTIHAEKRPYKIEGGWEDYIWSK